MDNVRKKQEVDYENLLLWIVKLTEDGNGVGIEVCRGKNTEYDFTIQYISAPIVVETICDYVAEMQEIMGFDVIHSVTTDGEETIEWITTYDGEANFEAQMASLWRLFTVTLSERECGIVGVEPEVRNVSLSI